MGRRGIAAATVIALMVILAVTIFAMVKLVQAYSAARESLASVAAAAQRPTLVIESIMPTASGLDVVVENKGNQPANVTGAYVFEYSASGSPTNEVPCTNISSIIVPVGGNFTCFISSSVISRVAMFQRSLRLEVLTSKGPVLFSLPPPLGNLIINVQQPQWMSAAPGGASEYYVLIWCPEPVAPNTPPTAMFSVMSSAVSTGPTTRTIYVPNLTAVGDCTVELVYKGPYRVLLGQFPLNSPSPAETEEETVTIQMSQVAPLAPGDTATVTFTMPEAVTNTTIQPIPSQQPTPIVYDFSWYFYPALTNANSGSNVYGTNGSNSYIGSVYEVVQDLVQSGVIDVSSPAGCAINTESAYQAFNLSVKTFWAGPSGFSQYAIDNGIPLVAECSGASGVEEALTVSVPFTVPASGYYVVIPIFSAYVGNPNNQHLWPPSGASLSVNVLLSGPGVTAKEAWGVNRPALQYAEPLNDNRLYLPAGQYTLTIDLFVSAGSSSSPVLAALVLSKIVLIPVTNAPAFCAIEASPDTFPFATVNLQTMSVTRDAPVMLNYAISTNYFSSSSQDQDYIYAFNGSSGYFYATSGYVELYDPLRGLEGITGENAVPYYIQSASYSVTVSDQVSPGSYKYVIGGLYAYSGPYTPNPSTNPLYNSPSGITLPNLYEIPLSTSGSWIFLYSQGVYGRPGADMTVTVNGQPGDYVVLGLFGAASFGIVSTSSVSVSGGTLLYGIQPNEYVGDISFYTPIVVRMTSYTTTITITPPINSYDEGLVGLINVEVVSPQSGYSVVAGPGLGGQNLGILLENVVSPTGTVNAELLRADTGQLLASWAAYVPQNQPTSVLLNAGALGASGWSAGLQYLDQQVPFLLVIYGAYCGG